MDIENNYIFKNKTKPNKKTFQESFRKLSFRFTKKELIIFLVAICLCILTTIIPSIIKKTELFTKQNMILYIIVGALIVLIVFLYLLLPFIFANITMKRIKKASKEDFIIESTFEQDKVIVNTSLVDNLSEFKYENIVYCVETKDNILMQLDTKQGVMLDKSGFENVTVNEFKSFIKSKCPTAKIKW